MYLNSRRFRAGMCMHACVDLGTAAARCMLASKHDGKLSDFHFLTTRTLTLQVGMDQIEYQLKMR